MKKKEHPKPLSLYTCIGDLFVHQSYGWQPLVTEIYRDRITTEKQKTKQKQKKRSLSRQQELKFTAKERPFFLSKGEKKNSAFGRVDPLIHPYPLNDQGQGMTVAESRRSRRLQSRPSAGGGARWQATARKIRCRPSTRRTIRRAGASSSVKGSTQMPRSRISILESSIDGWDSRPTAPRPDCRSIVSSPRERTRSLARPPPSPMRKQGGC